MPIVINTEDVNRYGYRILTAGIDLRSYKKNPVLCWNHNTYGMLPIGKMTELKVENGKLTGEPVFDEEDDFGKAAKRKYDNGMLNACSLNVRIMERSDDRSVLKQGQTRATVTKSELLEVSMVVLPGNKAAVKLSGDNDTDDIDDLLPKLNFDNKTNSKMSFKAIALSLGLNENADEAAILSATAKLKADAEAAQTDRVNALLSLGEKKGVVTEANKAAMTNLAKLSYNDAKAFIDSAAEPKEAQLGDTDEPSPLRTALSAAKLGAKTEGGDQSKEDWDFDTWSKKDSKGLLAMKANDPNKYQALALAYSNK